MNLALGNKSSQEWEDFLFLMRFYVKLCFCELGFLEGKLEASKRATNFVLAKTSNFLDTVLFTVLLELTKHEPYSYT
ncbi:hypothetical protein CSW08_07730 [Confluentibacter flavum]|uniref:Uncharacterized protein n=1 Tax=Confluentibacter flavum TaxID=1909700 RepID=A0A2N3HKM8_9FLAO|nr:hypothetical protein CSW08_07730 [Confluentibacter flavum]